MPELALRTPTLPAEVDWPAWKAAGIVRVHAPAAAWPAAAGGVAAAGIEPVADIDLDGELAPGRSVCLRLSAGGLAGGAWDGAAPVSGLDALAALLAVEDVLTEAARTGADADRARTALERYRRARAAGYARADLPAETEAVALLLGDDADRVLAARAVVVARDVACVATRARAGGTQRILLEADPPPAERDGLLTALSTVVDRLLIPLAPPLSSLLQAAIAGRSCGVGGAVVELPAADLRNPEQLADVLDLLDGAGYDAVVLATNPGWLPIGGATVARAAARLHGRSGSLDHERQRRTELREA